MAKKLVFPILMFLGFVSTCWLSCHEENISDDLASVDVMSADRNPARACRNMRAWNARATAGGIITGCPGDYRTPTRNHAGIDIAGKYGSKIKAAFKGVVQSAAWKDGYGRTTVINHNNGKCGWYAHLSKYGPKSGSVSRGSVIGYMGNSGTVRRRRGGTGTHLHYEMRNCKPIGRGPKAKAVKAKSDPKKQKSKACKYRPSQKSLVCDSVPLFSGCKKIRDKKNRYVGKFTCSKNPWVKKTNSNSGSSAQ